jgi:hypothetical protein
MGQFLDHDMTFDTASRLGVPTPPQNSPNSRTPSFDLDSVYGGGPTVRPDLYENDRIKLRIGNGGLFEDLPRGPGTTAIIGDPRNDENVIIAGLHCAVILFHNNMVDWVRANVGPANVFANARRLTSWHYQWVILREFLPLFVGQPTVSDILANGGRFFRPAVGRGFIPVEFQIAYRFGHSLVRPFYPANLGSQAANLPGFAGPIFDSAQNGNNVDPEDLRGGFRARRRFVGWQSFFDFGGAHTSRVRQNKRIDTKLSTALFRLPIGAIASGQPPISLAERNLLRHLTWSVPSGQRIAGAMGVPRLTADELSELRVFSQGFENSTPLWYYVLKEADLKANGERLGPVGGRIVGEVFIGLLRADPGSFLNVAPSFRPTVPISDPARGFRMVDFLRFARVDPDSRGAIFGG